MKYSQIIVAAAMAAVANAHSRVWSIAVDGVSQGNGLDAGGYIRSPPNNNPLKDLTSNDLRCNVNNSPAAKTVDVKAGAKVSALCLNVVYEVVANVSNRLPFNGIMILTTPVMISSMVATRDQSWSTLLQLHQMELDQSGSRFLRRVTQEESGLSTTSRPTEANTPSFSHLLWPLVITWCALRSSPRMKVIPPTTSTLLVVPNFTWLACKSRLLPVVLL